MTRALPPHISPTHVLAAAERLFHAAALKHSRAECRNRELKEAHILEMARHKVDVFRHDILRALSGGGYDDYCI